MNIVESFCMLVMNEVLSMTQSMSRVLYGSGTCLTVKHWTKIKYGKISFVIFMDFFPPMSFHFLVFDCIKKNGVIIQMHLCLEKMFSLCFALAF